MWAFAVAPEMSEQFEPALLQRRHWYAYEVGELDQEPFEAVRVRPCPAVPEMVGRAVLRGALPVGVVLPPGEPPTETAVLADFTTLKLSSLLAYAQESLSR